MIALKLADIQAAREGLAVVDAEVNVARRALEQYQRIVEPNLSVWHKGPHELSIEHIRQIASHEGALEATQRCQSAMSAMRRLLEDLS